MRKRIFRRIVSVAQVILGLLLLVPAIFVQLNAQVDQGGINVMVQDSTGAIIHNADLTLTSDDTGLVLHGKSNDAGFYSFYPLKIGRYTLAVSASGFESTVQKNIQVNVQQRVMVPIALRIGSATETVTVTTAPPILQTDTATIGQTIDTEAINNTPLNGRNWVYIAQLSAGVAPANGSRGAGSGDFEANGQRAEQNNFILDGIDNNSNSVDFLNGSSYVVRPPPDALSEFKISTADFSAEFGHSAGAVMNATIKSGTNSAHGSLWEYWRNDKLDAKDWNALTVPKYRENQFGATFGGPILRNKLFVFGDAENNRIIFGQAGTYTVPTAKMRNGDFTELLNTSFTGQAQPIILYAPNSGGASLLAYNGQQNIFAPSQIDSVAQAILKLYPNPTSTASLTNNYTVNLNDVDNTFHWDLRADWNVSSNDQAFVRFSYTNEPSFYPAPLGSILDGNGARPGGNTTNLGENFALSETHIFSPRLVNEFRFGYNYGHFVITQLNPNVNEGALLGMGGLPFGADFPKNGGLPNTSISGITTFGSRTFRPSDEGENVFQILDNVTSLLHNHSFHMGGSMQAVRVAVLQPNNSHGAYSYSATYTSNRGASYTGYGVADFLANQMKSASISNMSEFRDARWYDSAYIQDDWKVSARLTVNLGLRYDYFQPVKDVAGRQANFTPTGPLSAGSGSAQYMIPSRSKSVALATAFTSLLTTNNITLNYTDNDRLVQSQKTNFGPRIGFAYQLDDKTVLRSGFGIFYGGLASQGGSPNLGQSYPFEFTDSFVAPSCTSSGCASNGITLETGFATYLAAGLKNFASTPSLVGYDPVLKTPYSTNYNLTAERTFASNYTASLAYVGSQSRHLDVFVNPNGPLALVNPSVSVQTVRPFPSFNDVTYTHFGGMSNYNSLQAILTHRMSSGLSFLATYTWSRSMDDAPTALGTTGDPGYRGTNLIPINYEYARSAYDVPQRITFNGSYALPFGSNRTYLNHVGKVADLAVGGWQTSLTFQAQVGEPFSVSPNITLAGGISASAIRIRNPFTPGGTPDSTNSGITCAVQTKTKAHWYNPCAFANPLAGSTIASGTQITNFSQVLNYAGGRRDSVAGPGYERINMSLFKRFTVFKESSFEFRADAFNLFNTPSLGNPSITTDATSGGQITGPRSFQNYTPDARFLQLSMKASF